MTHPCHLDQTWIFKYPLNLLWKTGYEQQSQKRIVDPCELERKHKNTAFGQILADFKSSLPDCKMAHKKIFKIQLETDKCLKTGGNLIT